MATNGFTSTLDGLVVIAQSGTPAFQGDDVGQSSPANASPYISDFGRFRLIFGESLEKRILIDALIGVKAELSRHCIVRAVLVGGSVVRLARPEAKDCDAVFFYELRSTDSPEAAVTAIMQIGAEARIQKLDLRFVPTDSDPISLIKSCCYFSLLFAAEKSGTIPKFGTVLLTDD